MLLSLLAEACMTIYLKRNYIYAKLVWHANEVHQRCDNIRLGCVCYDLFFSSLFFCIIVAVPVLPSNWSWLVVTT